MNIAVIARPCFDYSAFADVLSQTGASWRRTPNAKDSEELVEVAGRICYFSFGDTQSEKDNAHFIRDLLKMGHTSVLEHVSWTFLITGISRALSHQLVRHRIGISFSQLSQQFHDETDAEFVEPAQLHHNPGSEEIWRQAVESSKEAYVKLKRTLESSGRFTDDRTLRSIARSVLPNATETKLIATANARELRHLIALRGSKSCEHEMRCFIALLLRKLQDESSALFSDLSIAELEDGSPYVVQARP